jgi:plastocyanin
VRRLLIPLITLSLLVAACGGDDDDNPTAGGSDTTETDDADHSDGGHDETGAVADDARVIVVAASSFAFGPDEIEAEADEDLAIELTSEDIEHDFVIDELDDLHVVGVEAGETKTGGFTAPEAGQYTYYCAVAGHRDAGMEGTLVVT